MPRKISLQEARLSALRGEIKHQDIKPKVKPESKEDKPDQMVALIASINESTRANSEATARVMAEALARIERKNSDNVLDIVKSMPKPAKQWEFVVKKRDNDGNIVSFTAIQS